MASAHNKIPPLRGTHQAWVRANLWNKRARQRSQVINVLLDSGAGGGNYASTAFIRGVERTEYAGRNMISKRGRGRLRAANPENSGVPPMDILGTRIIFLVFPPVDGIFGAKVRVVEGLPVGVILGTAFMRQYESALLFDGPGSGWFKPTPTSKRVPLLPWLMPPSGRLRSSRENEDSPLAQVVEDERATTCRPEEWIPSEDPQQSTLPSELLAMDALDLGVTAWEDEGTLQ